MHSIRGRIIAITAAAVTASILVFMTITYFTLGDEAARNTAEKMNMMCRNVQLSLDEYLASIRQSVEMAARFATDSLDPVDLVECGAAGSNAGKERTRAQVRRLDMYLAEHSAQVQEAFASVASHTSGVVTYYYCIAPEISGSEHGFFYSKIRRAFRNSRRWSRRSLTRRIRCIPPGTLRRSVGDVPPGSALTWRTSWTRNGRFPTWRRSTGPTR